MEQIVRYRWWGYLAFFLSTFSIFNAMTETNDSDYDIFWVVVPISAVLSTAVVAGVTGTWLRRTGRLERDDNWLQER